jgi:tyrosine phenol-lyase
MSTSSIEPFRIKMVEAITMSDRFERAKWLADAEYNLFKLRADQVIIDLLTDSGTGAMSTSQWAGIMRGDESYAGGESFYRFEAAVHELFGFQEVLPTHQGRAAEAILFGLLCQPGSIIPSNTHFDTTRANIELRGGTATDLPCVESNDPSSDCLFKGNIDLERLDELLSGPLGERVPLVMITLTNNAGGGQPASFANLRDTAALCRAHAKPFYIDACRFAENAYLIKQREPEFAQDSVKSIARRIFDLADGCTMSAKKDGMSNIGGFLATRDAALATRAKVALTLAEGFPTYGGLAGRDLEAIAVGLYEALEERYLAYRVRTIAYTANRLTAGGVPALQPPGGHAVFIDAGRLCPHIKPHELPGIALINAIYLEAGVRAVEVGTLMFGRFDLDSQSEQTAPRELIRLALPRRVYTQSQIDYAIDGVIRVGQRAEALNGYEITAQASALRHFTARLRPIPFARQAVPHEISPFTPAVLEC